MSKWTEAVLGFLLAGAEPYGATLMVCPPLIWGEKVKTLVVKLGLSGVLDNDSLDCLTLGEALALNVEDDDELLLPEVAGDGVLPVRARAELGLDVLGPGGLMTGTGSGS